MEKNMGTLDRGIRVGLAAMVILLMLFNVIQGTAAVILGILALVFVVTSAVGFCPLYKVLKVSTKK